jgi:glycosyltransferase involved in cell wall biosynthesis
MKNAICVAAHDGLVSMVTGVGVVVNSFVESFKEIKDNVDFLNKNETDLICLAPYLREGSKDYNLKLRTITKEACESNGGELVDIPTFSDGSSQGSIWGGPNQWRSASLSAASYLSAVSKSYDSMILFANDTIFSSVRNYIPKLNNLTIVWVPHSLGIVFKDEFSDPERIKIEKKSIEAVLNSDKDVIGYIGNHFRDVLHKGYGVNYKRLIPFINGLSRNSFRFKVSDSQKDQDIKKYGIPLDKKLIFSWGRCVFQKGYDLLIPAYKKFLEENPDYHLVLLMPTETSMQEYLNQVDKEISKLYKNSITAIYEFNDTLPYSILCQKNLRITVFASRFEGAPITPLEALTFSGKNVNFVYSSIPSLSEIFEGNRRAVKIRNLTVDSVYNALKSAVKIKEDQRMKYKVPSIVENYSNGLNLIVDKGI